MSIAPKTNSVSVLFDYETIVLFSKMSGKV